MVLEQIKKVKEKFIIEIPKVENSSMKFKKQLLKKEMRSVNIGLQLLSFPK
jgi:hypothetical protein